MAPFQMAALIEETKATREGGVFAFVPVSNTYDNHGWILGVADLGTAGYTPLSAANFFEGYNEAADVADELNRALGLNEKTAIAIFADTMHRQKTKDNVDRMTVVFRDTTNRRHGYNDVLLYTVDRVTGDDLDKTETIKESIARERHADGVEDVDADDIELLFAFHGAKHPDQDWRE